MAKYAPVSAEALRAWQAGRDPAVRRREKAWRSAARINKPVRPRPPGTPPQTPSPYQYQPAAPQRGRG